MKKNKLFYFWNWNSCILQKRHYKLKIEPENIEEEKKQFAICFKLEKYFWNIK